MQDALTTILSSASLSVLLTAVLMFLFRSWISERLKASIQHEYDQKLETHKAELRSQTETEIVRLKAQLEIAAAERQVQYSRVFEKTADVIAETYKKLLAIKDAADNYTQPVNQHTREQKEQLAEKYQQKTRDFLEYYLPNKIYVPRETAERIRDFSNTLHRMTVQFSMAMAVGRSPTREPDTYGKLFDSFFKSSDEVPKLLELLEADFQKLLGLSSAQKPAL